jgi:hypothetical protein
VTQATAGLVSRSRFFPESPDLGGDIARRGLDLFRLQLHFPVDP